MSERRLIAVTGGTGFIGRATVQALLDQGYRVRIFARNYSSKLLFQGHEVEIVLGDLSDRVVQFRLLKGADYILHMAGATKAWKAQGFFEVNHVLTKSLLENARQFAPKARFILVSSLAAREAELSPYAASKRAAEDVVKELWDEKSWVIIRPPAVYGPGDKELWPLFKAARKGILPLPMTKQSRVAMIHVSDLADDILNVLDEKNCITNCIIEVSDENNVGYTPKDIGAAFEKALGRSLKQILIPLSLLKLAAIIGKLSRWFARQPPMLLPHKIPELTHADWSVRRSHLQEGKARITLSEGLLDTLNWYRKNIKNFN